MFIFNSGSLDKDSVNLVACENKYVGAAVERGISIVEAAGKRDISIVCAVTMPWTFSTP